MENLTNYLEMLLTPGIIVTVFGALYLNGRRKKKIMVTGDLAMAVVVEIHQTGTMINNSPVMSMRLRLEQAGMVSREIQLRETIDLGNIPRVGEQVYISLSKTSPNEAVFMGLVSTCNSQMGLSALKTEQVMDTTSLAPNLRESKTFGIATIQSIEPGSTSETIRFGLEIDSCVEPKRFVATEQMLRNNPFQVGDRAYIFVSGEDKNAVAVVPLSLIGGKKIDPNSNRLDALVLGPQILHEGKKAMATVLEAEQVELNSDFLAKRGAQRWRLKFLIKPADGTASYHTEQTLTFTQPERIHKACKVGAEVPMRVDWNDPSVVVTDSIAEGFPDPYLTVKEMYQEALAAGEIKMPT